MLFTTGYTRNAMLRDGRLDGHVDLMFKARTLGARVRAVLDRADPIKRQMSEA